ncbi:MAG TPA: lipid II flippase MurJ, partial [Polyangiaceae bacterium]|nr:lipid II flippase MurJ [Polyangiaceae bacterium]
MSGRAIVRTTLLLLPMQLVFRAGEALLPLFLAMWFGRSDATDVYQMAWAVFNFAGSLVFTIFQDSALVPILAEVKLSIPRPRTGLPEPTRDTLAEVTGSILAHTWLVGGALSAVVGLLALGFFSVRYQGDAWALSVQMVPIFCVFLVALSVKTFFAALLNADHRYFAQPIASSAGVVTNLLLVATLHDRFGVLSIAMGSLAGELVAISVLLFISLRWVGMRITPTLARPEPVIRFARLVASEVGGSAVTRINPVVDQLMAGLAGVVGGATLLRYSGDVASLPTSLLQAALLPVLLSHLSDDFVGGRLAKFRATVARSVLIVGAILLAGALFIFLIREPL